MPSKLVRRSTLRLTSHQKALIKGQMGYLPKKIMQYKRSGEWSVHVPETEPELG